MQGSPHLCISDYFRLQEVAAEFVRVSMSNPKEVIVKLGSKHHHFHADQVRLVVPDTQDTHVYETDVTALCPADQHFVPPKLVPLQNYLNEQQILDRVKGVVQFAAADRPQGKIATLKHGSVSVRQSDVIGGGLMQVGQLCNFNITFSPSLDRRATFVLLGPKAENRQKEVYRQAAKQVDLKDELEMSKPESVALFSKHAKDMIATIKRSANVSVDAHASKIAAEICRKKKRS